ncbi:MAG TPA: hypothetical protein PJ986_17765 [Gammaproteobacteria bacterium]|nr:hypothetical protein [Gammaproteobacteria bacterium]
MRSASEEAHCTKRGTTPWVLMMASLLAVGCASTGGPGATPDPTPSAQAASADEDRVKQVFVYQGRVANDLLERYQFADGPEAEMDPVLSAAEARMNETCSFLNQAAVAYLAGSEPGWRLKMRVYASVDDCEAAADDVAALLDQQSQPFAVSELAR